MSQIFFSIKLIFVCHFALCHINLPIEVVSTIPQDFKYNNEASNSESVVYSNNEGQYISFYPIIGLNDCIGFDQKKIMLTNEIDNTKLVLFDDGKKLSVFNNNENFPYSEKVLMVNGYWYASQTFAIFCYDNKNYILTVSTPYSSLKGVKKDEKITFAREKNMITFFLTAYSIFELD